MKLTAIAATLLALLLLACGLDSPEATRFINGGEYHNNAIGLR
jgi:hypothetical protein